MEQTIAVFDLNRPIALQLRTPAGVKTIRVRFPSDEEWTERQRRRKVIIKQLGRGVSETIIGNAEDADAALLAKIRDGEGPEVDPFEASRIIEQLSQAEVDDVVQTGDSFPRGITTGDAALVQSLGSGVLKFESRPQSDSSRL